MICDICREEIAKGKHVMLDATPKAVINVCKKCVVHALRAPDHATIAKGGLIELPQLVFAIQDRGKFIILGEKDFCDIAMECGWVLTPTDEYYRCIVQHYFQSLNHRWWVITGDWAFEGNLNPRECFRKSCNNIRDYYAIWERSQK